MTRTTTLLAVDGNSLVHRSFHALVSSNLSTRDGRPTWAVKGFISQLLGAIERSGATAVVVGFDDHTHSVRKTAHPHYKATRTPKPPELGQQIAMTIDLLRAAGVHVVVPAGLEADDVLASAAATAAAAGWRTVIVTSDRDSFALIDDTTNVLRVINGGIEASPILTPDRLVTMIGVHPSSYREYAAMRGDTSDNLAGIHGVGEKGAAKLLAAFPSVEAAFADVDAGGHAVAAAMGKAYVAKLANPDSRAAYHRNVEIMTMHRDVPLGLDLSAPGAGLLPLEAEAVLRALDSLELASLRGYATKVLCREPGLPQVRVPQPPAGFDDVPYAEVPPAADEALFELPPPGAPPATLATIGAMRGSTAPRPTTFDDSVW